MLSNTILKSGKFPDRGVSVMVAYVPGLLGVLFGGVVDLTLVRNSLPHVLNRA